MWQGADYIGFGPAAASRVGCQRWANSPDLDAYLSCHYTDTDKAGTGNASAGTATIETLAPETDAIERFMFAFRLCDGISPEAFAERQGPAARRLLPNWLATLSSLADEGLMEQKGDRWALSTTGRDFADTVAEQFLE